MKIAIHGLGKMGLQIAERLAQESHTVVAHNRSPQPIETAASFGAIGAPTKQDVLKQFEDEQIVLWLMLPADVVSSQLDEWLELLPSGSVVVDGGNSDYRHTRTHAAAVASHGSQFVDVGTSGGILGLTTGFSMMAGGDQPAFERIRPVLDSLSKPAGGYHYFGPAGAGHYVKMVHNAIEYGMMESIAEGYRLLKEGAYDSLDLAAAGKVWQESSIIASGLNKLTAIALEENPELDGIEGYVAESGEARWALETAKEKNIALPSIAAAFQVRLDSQNGSTNFATKLLAAMRNKFGGHSINKDL